MAEEPEVNESKGIKQGEIPPFYFFDKTQGWDNPVVVNAYKNVLSALGLDFNEVMKGITDPSVEPYGNMFAQYLDKYFEDNGIDRHAFCKEKLAEMLKTIDLSDPSSLYALAYMGEMSSGFIPYDTVFTASIMVGEGKSLQMGCGQGKTGVLAMAAYKILQDPDSQVVLTSSTSILAEDALDKMDLYEALGLLNQVAVVTSDAVVFPTIGPDGKGVRDPNDKKNRIIKNKITRDSVSPEEWDRLVAKAYGMRFISADNASLMHDAMDGKFSKPTGNMKRELLADEADYVLLDQYRPVEKTKDLEPGESDRRIAMRKEAYTALNAFLKTNKGSYKVDDINQYVDFTNEGRVALVEYLKNQYQNSEYDLNEMFDYVYDALVAQTVYKEGRDFELISSKGEKGPIDMLISEDRASGAKIDLPQGIKQALQIRMQAENKYVGPIEEEKDVTDTINVKSFFTEYFNHTKHFVSGTLGLDSNEIVSELTEVYNVSLTNMFNIRAREKQIKKDQGKTFFKSADEKRNAIVENMLYEHNRNNRPVLIGTKSADEVAKLSELINGLVGKNGKKIVPLIYTATSEEIFKQDTANLSDEEFKEKYDCEKNKYKDFAELIKKDGGKPGRVIIGTDIIGRGTTIEADDINHLEGLHVILDGMHETSSRNPVQFRNRTNRGSNDGSTIEFYSYDEMTEEEQKKFTGIFEKRGTIKGSLADKIYEAIYSRIDKREANVRANINKFVELQASGRNNIERIAKSQKLSKEDTEMILAMYMSRTRSIRTRAQGISDKFEDRVDEYKKELDAFTKLYIHKIKNPEEKMTDAEFLTQLGCGYLADAYIPYSEKTQKMIARKEGIDYSKVSENIKNNAIRMGSIRNVASDSTIGQVQGFASKIMDMQNSKDVIKESGETVQESSEEMVQE